VKQFDGIPEVECSTWRRPSGGGCRTSTPASATHLPRRRPTSSPTTGTLLVRFVNDQDSASFNLGVELSGEVG
jgi:hypothetical protein